LPLLLLSSLVAGCFTPTAGVYGTLAFEYRIEDELFGHADATDWLAPGTEVQLEVFAAKGAWARRLRRERQLREPDVMLHDALAPQPPRSSLERSVVHRVSNDRPDVLEVLAQGPSGVRLRSVGPGTALLRIEADGGQDAIPIRVEPAHRAEVFHWGLEGLSGLERAWLKGSTGRFVLRAWNANGDRLVGYGDPAPLAVSPAGAASVSRTPTDTAHIDVRFLRAGEVTLEPTRGKPLGVRVIDQQAILQLELRTSKGGRLSSTVPMLTPLADGTAGTDVPLFVVARLADEKVLLLGSAVTVRAGPPAVCSTISADEGGTVRRVLGDGFEGVHLLAPGGCIVEASLPGGASARGEIAIWQWEKR
jgi:hypothetical protein